MRVAGVEGCDVLGIIFGENVLTRSPLLLTFFFYRLPTRNLFNKEIGAPDLHGARCRIKRDGFRFVPEKITRPNSNTFLLCGLRRRIPR